jgi:hypothetical protein
MKYKIYKLVYNGVVKYVGRTKQTLNQRKWRGYKRNAAVQAIYKQCDIELIEETNDVSREDYWIQHYKDTVLNKIRGDTGLTKEEYHKEYHKEWRDSNREHYNQYMREYRLKNKKKK